MSDAVIAKPAAKRRNSCFVIGRVSRLGDSDGIPSTGGSDATGPKALGWALPFCVGLSRSHHEPDPIPQPPRGSGFRDRNAVASGSLVRIGSLGPLPAETPEPC